MANILDHRMHEAANQGVVEGERLPAESSSLYSLTPVRYAHPRPASGKNRVRRWQAYSRSPSPASNACVCRKLMYEHPGEFRSEPWHAILEGANQGDRPGGGHDSLRPNRGERTQGGRNQGHPCGAGEKPLRGGLAEIHGR